MDALVFLVFAAAFLQAAWKSFERVIDVVNCLLKKQKFTKEVGMKFSLLIVSIVVVIQAKLGLLGIVAEPVFGKGMVQFGLIDPVLTGMLISQGAVAVQRLLDVLKGTAQARTSAPRA